MIEVDAVARAPVEDSHCYASNPDHVLCMTVLLTQDEWPTDYIKSSGMLVLTI